jgi:Lrp/AsnC family leucine-responsive transcriptional regulator
MEKEGVILGYHARLDPQALGLSLLVFVEIKLSAKSGGIFEKYKKEIIKLPSVLECHLVSGDFDYLIKARIPKMADYRTLLGDILLTLPGAQESRSYIVMEEVKETLSLPLTEAE